MAPQEKVGQSPVSSIIALCAFPPGEPGYRFGCGTRIARDRVNTCDHVFVEARRLIRQGVPVCVFPLVASETSLPFGPVPGLAIERLVLFERSRVRDYCEFALDEAVFSRLGTRVCKTGSYSVGDSVGLISPDGREHEIAVRSWVGGTIACPGRAGLKPGDSGLPIFNRDGSFVGYLLGEGDPAVIGESGWYVFQLHVEVDPRIVMLYARRRVFKRQPGQELNARSREDYERIKEHIVMELGEHVWRAASSFDVAYKGGDLLIEAMDVEGTSIAFAKIDEYEAAYLMGGRANLADLLDDDYYDDDDADDGRSSRGSRQYEDYEDFAADERFEVRAQEEDDELWAAYTKTGGLQAQLHSADLLSMRAAGVSRQWTKKKKEAPPAPPKLAPAEPESGAEPRGGSPKMRPKLSAASAAYIEALVDVMPSPMSDEGAAFLAELDALAAPGAANPSLAGQAPAAPAPSPAVVDSLLDDIPKPDPWAPGAPPPVAPDYGPAPVKPLPLSVLNPREPVETFNQSPAGKLGVLKPADPFADWVATLTLEEQLPLPPAIKSKPKNSKAAEAAPPLPAVRLGPHQVLRKEFPFGPELTDEEQENLDECEEMLRAMRPQHEALSGKMPVLKGVMTASVYEEAMAFLDSYNNARAQLNKLRRKRNESGPFPDNQPYQAYAKYSDALRALYMENKELARLVGPQTLSAEFRTEKNLSLPTCYVVLAKRIVTAANDAKSRLDYAKSQAKKEETSSGTRTLGQHLDRMRALREKLSAALPEAPTNPPQPGPDPQ